MSRQMLRKSHCMLGNNMYLPYDLIEQKDLNKEIAHDVACLTV